MKTLVSELLSLKGTFVVQTCATTPVREAVRIMVGQGVGSVVITHGDQVAGVLSERDCLKRVLLEGRDADVTRCGEVMATGGPFAKLDHTVEECMKLMARYGRRHLPVMASAEIVGIVSLRDCAAHLTRAATHEADELREYVSGSYPPESYRGVKAG